MLALKRSGGEAIDEDSVDEWLVKRTIGGPKRFRPKSREEIVLEAKDWKQKYLKLSENYHQLRKLQQQSNNEGKVSHGHASTER